MSDNSKMEMVQHRAKYRVAAKKLHTKLMAIGFSILNGFSKFFHCWKAK